MSCLTRVLSSLLLSSRLISSPCWWPPAPLTHPALPLGLGAGAGLWHLRPMAAIGGLPSHLPRWCLVLVRQGGRGLVRWGGRGLSPGWAGPLSPGWKGPQSLGRQSSSPGGWALFTLLATCGVPLPPLRPQGVSPRSWDPGIQLGHGSGGSGIAGWDDQRGRWSPRWWKGRAVKLLLLNE